MILKILTIFGFVLSCLGISTTIYLLLTRKADFREQLFLFLVGVNSVICATVLGMLI